MRCFIASGAEIITAMELYKLGINLFIFHLSLCLYKYHLPTTFYFLILRQFFYTLEVETRV